MSTANARLCRVQAHLGAELGAKRLAVRGAPCAKPSCWRDAQMLESRLQELFGQGARVEGPLARSGAGRRYLGVDLRDKLTVQQVDFLLDSLAHFRILSLAGQQITGSDNFTLQKFERFANHWGAPVPHPNNFTRGGQPGQGAGATDGEIMVLPWHARTAARVNEAFAELQCLPHNSPAVLVVSNVTGATRPTGSSEASQTKPEWSEVSGGGTWHTDIEYEPLPMYVSMFLVHSSPTARNPSTGTWVVDPPPGRYFSNQDLTTRPELPPLAIADPELSRLRESLPLNGETAFADTAAAFAALPQAERDRLSKIQVRRRLNEGDDGWMAPLVRTNPRSGLPSLHSPIWASRPHVRPPIDVVGMSAEQGRLFLDRLEAHVLQPQFRYDHIHRPGDVTIWDNYMTLHNSTPSKRNISRVEDARLLYRLSCKGNPCLELPRSDDEAWLKEHIAGGYSTPVEIQKS